ncbi:MAG TPA: PhzF family phenazine biosynthesis protein [Burkholderiales bacterium]|nr:PhzF family phenazine biosynthesis protein [Burkholderiales bacterium]
MRFKQVDVFTRKPFLGNPVAVVLDAEGLDTAAMQRIACWTNLSETTFVLKSEVADYRLRIFTPRQELPFAGHPTIGSAHAALEAGLVARKSVLKQECGAGLIELAFEDERIFLKGPEAKLAPLEHAHREALAHGLGEKLAEAMRVDVGPVWLVAEVAEVATLKPDMAHLAALSQALDAAGATLYSRSNDGESAIHVRSFAPAHGIPEDPVCGSGNLSVAAFLAFTKKIDSLGKSYLARQGMALGRDGRVSVRIDPDGIRIGGHAVTCVEGTLTPP